MTPSLIYFDLGNVIMLFDREVAFQQIAETAGITPERVKEIVLDSGLQDRLESGLLGTDEFFEIFCDSAGRRLQREALLLAASNMFCPNRKMVPLITQLVTSGYRLGILSNTCELHWQYIANRYRLVRRAFSIAALSFQLGHLKPDPRIYAAAAELAGVAATDIFFVDDLIENVEAARKYGFDAVLYTDVPTLTSELRTRGVRVNL